MSDSELLRIKNKRNASYKNRKTARSNTKILTRPNDRFGFRKCFVPKNQLFCGKTFYKGNLFLTNEKEEKHKNAYPLTALSFKNALNFQYP